MDTDIFFEVLSLCHTVQIDNTSSTAASSSATNSSTGSSNNDSSDDFDDNMVAAAGFGNNKVSPSKVGVVYTDSTAPLDETDGSTYEYNASSPDEKALVEACRL